MSVSSSELAPPTPSPASECALHFRTKGGGGQHSLAGEGAGGANSADWRESLELCKYSVILPLFEPARSKW